MFEQKKHLETPKTDLSVNDEPNHLPEFSPVNLNPRPNYPLNKIFISTLLIILLSLVGFSLYKPLPGSSSDSPLTYTSPSDLSLDTKNWLYDETSDIYYQVRVIYTSKPVSNEVNSLSIFVPGQFLDCIKTNEKYTCTKNPDSAVNGYTAATAPVLFPIDIPEYAGKSSPDLITTEAKTYTEKGFVYVDASTRGLNPANANYETAAPWGITDAKAALRYLRYNADKLPGDLNKIFAFGMSGGVQSAILGTSGDSKLYTPYLESIGALMTDQNNNPLSDSVFAVSSWNPLTGLESANSAYEWSLGQFSTSNTRTPGTWTKQLSNDLAAAFPAYLNSLGLKSGNTTLKLGPSKNGIYTSGTYYDYLLSLLNSSLNNYLNKNFSTAAEKKNYINSLNTSKAWITYKKGKATISSLADFVTHQIPPTEPVGAFDSPDRSALGNTLFALGKSAKTPKHFDRTLTDLLKTQAGQYSVLDNYDPSTASAEADLAEVDSKNNPASVRLDMYCPLYFTLNTITRPDEQASTFAKNWYIRSDITEPNIPLTSAANLSLALKMNQIRTAPDALNHVSSVTFDTFWQSSQPDASTPEDFFTWVESLTRSSR